jgi:mRNA interferase RelE/StbE
MTYKVIFSQDAEKDLDLLDRKNRTRIIKKLDHIKGHPLDYVKHLVGIPLYSLRVGDYRVIMDIKTKEILIFVIKVGHRSKVYGNP